MATTLATEQLPHIFILGGTGRTGRLFIREVLQRGYTLTALARSSAALEHEQDLRLKVVQGQSTVTEDVRRALNDALDHAGTHKIVIVSTLGQQRKSGNPWAAVTTPPMFMTQSITTLLTCIRELPAGKIAKLVIMSMFGVAESFQNLHFALKPVMRHSNMLATVEDHNGVDKVVRAQNELQYVLVRSTMLTMGEAKGFKIRDASGNGEGWFPSSITTADVITFMLDCVTSSDYDSKTPVIVN